MRRKRSASPRSPRRPPSRSASRWRPEEFSSPEPARTSARGRLAEMGGLSSLRFSQAQSDAAPRVVAEVESDAEILS